MPRRHRRRRSWVPRWLRLIRRRLRLQTVAIGVGVLYISTIVLHVSNGFTLWESFGMVVRDARAVATCPHKPKEYWVFIDRGLLVSSGVGIAMMTGENVYDLVCSGEFREAIEGLP